jgi:hypothetical protein
MCDYFLKNGCGNAAWDFACCVDRVNNDVTQSFVTIELVIWPLHNSTKLQGNQESVTAYSRTIDSITDDFEFKLNQS